MLPNRVLAIIVCSSESTFVLGPIPPGKTSSAGSLYEYEPCNEKQKLHYQTKRKLRLIYTQANSARSRKFL